MPKSVKRIKSILLVSLLILAVLIWYAVFYFESRRNLLVTFFDVGQGDAIFIEAPNQNQILIDGGPDDKILSKLGRTTPFWDKSIDLLVLTHPHADHLDGLLEVLKRYEIGLVLESGVDFSLAEYQEWRRILQEKKVPVIIAQAGEIAEIAEGVSLEVLSPLENYQGKSTDSPHEAVVVTKIKYGDFAVLLTGDAERMVEYKMLMAEPEKLPARILKVGHHGSKTSSSPEFLQVVQPQETVISVGEKNRYNHPSQEALDRLTAIGAKIWRTDIDKDIRVESDGQNYFWRE